LRGCLSKNACSKTNSGSDQQKCQAKYGKDEVGDDNQKLQLDNCSDDDKRSGEEDTTADDENWEEARDNIRLTGVDEVLDFCLNAESSAGEACTEADYDADNGCEKSQDECIDEITELVEDYASTFAIVGIAVSVFMLVIMWFSYLSVRVWRSEGDDDDDDDDDE
jgi:hypothetical protein